MESQRPDSSAASPLVVLEGIHLDYGSVQVLKNINLTIHRGETHALVGEHAAGKSSLCSVISGNVRPTSGRVWVQGEPYSSLSLKKARNLGIEMVYQHNPVFNNLTIADNLFVTGRSSSLFPLFDKVRHREQARRFLRQHRFDFDPETILRSLAPADRDLIDILKHLYVGPRLIILDESLDKLKVENLHRIVDILNGLKEQGTSVLFVTHSIDDIYQIADRVSIIRDGELYISDSVHNIDKISLIKMAYTQITEPKRLDVTRREFHQLIKYSEAILQKLPINLVVVDNHNRIKMINEWARCFFCLGDAVVFNLPLRRLFSQANRQFLALVQQALRCEEEKDFFDVSLHIGGTRRRSHITIKPILDDSFRIGAMIVIEDITEQEKVREQMILSEKLASIGLLSAGVAHEINNPLETIHNFTEYLKFRIRDPEDRKVLSHVDEELNDIAQIVGNLISFSEAGLTGGEVFDLNGLIDQIIGLVRFNARSRKLRLSFRRQRGSLLLKAAPSEIKQVILNLLKNSFDAMPDGGDILISTGLARGDNCRSATITFRDSGRGIQGVNINDIFLPFYSTKSSPNHMGLGLSVSYGIVRKYGGEITVKNLHGKGCQFRISLPVLGNRGKEDQSTAAGAS